MVVVLYTPVVYDYVCQGYSLLPVQFLCHLKRYKITGMLRRAIITIIVLYHQ